MPVQQISSGGYSEPVVFSVDPTTGTPDQQNNPNTPQTDTNFNLTDWLAAVENTPNPNPSGQITKINPFTGDPNARVIENGHSSDIDSTDPFLFSGMAKELAAYNADTGSNIPLSTGTFAPETTASQGYKDFGQSWLDLLNTVGTQNLQWGGRNDFAPDLKGKGSVTPWDQQNLVGPWQSSDKKQAFDNSLDFITKNTGMDPSSKEAQQLAGSYLEYTLQNNNMYSLNAGEHASRDQGKGILGPLEKVGETIAEVAATVTGNPEIALAIALATAGQDFASGNDIGGVLDIAGAVGGGIGGLDPVDLTTIASDLGTVPSTLSDIGTGIQAGVGAATLGEGAASGNILQALSGAAGLAPGAVKAFDSTFSGPGTTGTNSTSSGGLTSSIANTVGLTPDQLKGILSGAEAAGTVAGTAVPIIENQLNAPGSLGLTPGVPPLPATPAPSPFVPSAPGEALTSSRADNPAQDSYAPPEDWKGNPSSLGGGLSLDSMLKSLGSPVG